MGVVIRVENHQPVPLVPLADLDWEEGDAVYIGRRVMREGSEYDDDGEGEAVGWVLMDSPMYGEQGYPFSLADRYALSNFDHYDQDKTMCRKLQPGEKLVVEYTA